LDDDCSDIFSCLLSMPPLTIHDIICSLPSNEGRKDSTVPHRPSSTIPHLLLIDQKQKRRWN